MAIGLMCDASTAAMVGHSEGSVMCARTCVSEHTENTNVKEIGTSGENKTKTHENLSAQRYDRPNYGERHHNSTTNHDFT